jgi:cytidine deaminase
MSEPVDELSAEDAKLVTLARGARGRVSAPSGAALRDETGRTYASANVSLPSLSLSAVVLAVAQAAASGAHGIEAIVVVGSEPTDADLAAARDLGGATVPVLVCASDGSVVARVMT